MAHQVIDILVDDLHQLHIQCIDFPHFLFHLELYQIVDSLTPGDFSSHIDPLWRNVDDQNHWLHLNQNHANTFAYQTHSRNVVNVLDFQCANCERESIERNVDMNGSTRQPDSFHPNCDDHLYRHLVVILWNPARCWVESRYRYDRVVPKGSMHTNSYLWINMVDKIFWIFFLSNEFDIWFYLHAWWKVKLTQEVSDTNFSVLFKISSIRILPKFSTYHCKV